MARLIGFQQEDGAPDGAGTFHFEDGSSTYAYSPDDAAPFLAGAHPPAPEPDQRLAMSDPADAYRTAAWQQAQGGVTIPDESAYVAPGGVSAPEASDVGGMSGGYSPAPPEPQGGMSPPTAPLGYGVDPSKLPVDTSPAPAAAPQAQPQGQPAAGAPAPRGQGPDPALVPYGAAPRGMQAKDMTVQYQEAGLPYSEAAAAARQKAAMGQAEVKGRWVEVERAQQQAAYLDALDKKNAAKEQIQQRQAKIEGIRKSYRQQRAAVQEEVNAAAQEKVDPDRFFTDRGPLARIGAAIAQAMGAYAAILGKSPNFAQEIIDKEINRDIAAQRDNIAKRGAEAKNKLSQLMQDYGLDIDEASNMLRASQQQLAESTVAAHASQSKDIELQKNYEEWLAQRAIDRQKEEEGYERESIGKRSGTVKFGRVDAGGAGATQLDKWAQSLGYPTYKALLADDAAKKSANPDHTWNDTIGQAQAAMKAKGDGAGAGAGGGRGSAKIFEQAGVAGRVIEQIDELKELMSHPTNALSPGQRARMEQLQNDINISYARARHGGAPTEVEIAHPPVSGSTDLLGSGRAKLDVMRQNMVRTKEHSEKGLTMGLRDATEESQRKDED